MFQNKNVLLENASANSRIKATNRNKLSQLYMIPNSPGHSIPIIPIAHNLNPSFKKKPGTLKMLIRLTQNGQSLGHSKANRKLVGVYGVFNFLQLWTFFIKTFPHFCNIPNFRRLPTTGLLRQLISMSLLNPSLRCWMEKMNLQPTN